MSRPATDTISRRWPWLIAAFATGLAFASLPLLILDWPTFKPGRIEPVWMTALVDVVGPLWAVAVLSVLAGFVLSRKPGSALGWTYEAIAVLVATSMFTQEYAVRALVATPGALPFGDVAAWIAVWAGLAQLPQVLAILLFPNGRLPGRAWWALAAVAALLNVGMVVSSFGHPWPLELPDRDGLLPVTMPPQLWGLGFALNSDARTLLSWGQLLLAPAVAGLLLWRTVRSHGEERHQLRWLAYALAIAAIFWVVGHVNDSSVFSRWAGDPSPDVVARWGQLGGNLTIAFVVPAAMSLAIFRYRLYDIDVVISRTLWFGGLAVFITATYVAIVVGAGSLMGATLNPLLALVATAIVAVAFQPARGFMNRLANRLVYGQRRSPYEALSRFGRQASLSYSADEALPRLALLLREATSAEYAEAWLRVGSDLRLVATDPPTASPAVLRIDGERLPALAPGGFAIAVRHEGVLLGALAIVKRRGERVNSSEIKLVEDLASQAGLLLRNLRLLEELRASRERIVRAQDEERRRVERNLHDGAQQQLVALSLSLGRARAATEKSNGKAAEILAGAEIELRTALADLRSLAQGIHPMILVTGGLEPAIRSLADRSPIPVEVTVAHGERPPESAEVAAYYVVAEALTNVAKHSRATTARVSIRSEGGILVAEVTDDGIGGAVASGGTGLQGLEDRTAAIGGRLLLVSRVGSGTRVRAEIPCD